ncbi:PREDICTED: endocuticle structural protein SgAbd-6-like [Papilio polytes]|uniref:endocuticle structural protein SgAbd-6-like n=1 Tax=Papilio polytes TaxID=76194 RepID=UPI000676189F|nr:PREDICTED: endocuticle structural protein SgAbd-6-like [Papilio polytes]
MLINMAFIERICLVAVLLATVESSPAAIDGPVQIIKYAYSNNGLGTYSFEFVASDGTYRKEEAGIINEAGTNTLTIRGEYGYLVPSGKYHSVRYIADANGFKPEIHDDDTRFNDRRII